MMIRQSLKSGDRRFLKLVQIVTVVIVAISPFYAFLSTWIGSAIGPLWFWKSLKDLVILTLAILVLGWALSRWQLSAKIIKHPILVLAIGFLLIAGGVSLANQVTVDASLAGWAFTLRYLLVFCIMFGSSWLLAKHFDISDRLIGWLVGITYALVIIGILQVTLLPVDFLTQFGYGSDTIAPVSIIDDNPDAQRAFATMSGPNDYGAFLLIPFGLALSGFLSGRKQILLIGASILGMLLSSSRSAWLGALVMLAVYIIIRYGKKIIYQPRLRIWLMAFIVTGTLVVYASTQIPALRLMVFHSSPDDTHLTEGSTDEHWKATGAGLSRVIDQPLGCGIGCAGPASFYSESVKISENYFVQVAEETSVIGLLAWLTLFGLVMRELYKIAKSNKLALGLFLSGLGLTIVGLWLHVWADDAVSLVWWALAGFLIGRSMSQVKVSKK